MEYSFPTPAYAYDYPSNNNHPLLSGLGRTNSNFPGQAGIWQPTLTQYFQVVEENSRLRNILEQCSLYLNTAVIHQHSSHHHPMTYSAGAFERDVFSLDWASTHMREDEQGMEGREEKAGLLMSSDQVTTTSNVNELQRSVGGERKKESWGRRQVTKNDHFSILPGPLGKENNSVPPKAAHENGRHRSDSTRGCYPSPLHSAAPSKSMDTDKALKPMTTENDL